MGSKNLSMGNRWNLGKRNAGYGAEIPNGETYKYGDSSSEIEIGGVGKDCAFFEFHMKVHMGANP